MDISVHRKNFRGQIVDKQPFRPPKAQKIPPRKKSGRDFKYPLNDVFKPLDSSLHSLFNRNRTSNSSTNHRIVAHSYIDIYADVYRCSELLAVACKHRRYAVCGNGVFLTVVFCCLQKLTVFCSLQYLEYV